MSVLDTCLKATGRNYPAGYGFALAYLKGEKAGPDHFKAMQAAAWDAVKRDAKAGGSDAARFVAAYAESVHAEHGKRGWPSWLIEAAQLVHGDALAGNRKSAAVMALWGHPGF